MARLGRRLLILLVLAAAAAACARSRAGEPILVLVSFDGWRWDYGQRAATPNLDALAARGVRASALIPVFPTKTFPNHYTIVTGLYPEHHGIVSNTMDDPAISERFTLTSDTVTDPRWWSGEPLWTTATRQGRRAASMFWPGSDVAIAGQRPTHWFPYDGRVTNTRRVEQVLEWLALPAAEQPSFITLYFSDVDSAGHDRGPDADETIDAAERVDGFLGRLTAGIRDLGLLDQVTIVVVSDHGMSQLSEERVIFLDDYIDLDTVEIVEWSPAVGLVPRAGSPAALAAALQGRHPALRAWVREETPQSLHYRQHPRIPPVLGLADDGWTVTSRARFARERASGAPMGGAHGFESSNTSMHGIFVAAGPRLRQGLQVPAFENVHLYELFCALLGLTPAPNDGDSAVTRSMLTE